MTVLDVLQRAQTVYLGDSDGDVYTPDFLLPFYSEALVETVQALGLHSSPPVKRTAYAPIPALIQTSLRGGVEWLPDYAEVVSIDWRPLGTQVLISAMATLTPSTVAITTSTAHGRAVGDIVEIAGGTPLKGALGQFVVASVADATHLVIQCHTWGGAYGAGSYILYGQGIFLPLLASVDWRVREGNVIEFDAASQSREFRVVYYTTPWASPQLTDEVLFPESGSYLSARSAMLAAKTNGAEGKANDLREECWGEGTLEEPRGGKLGMLISHAVRIQQLAPGIRPVHWTRQQLQRADYGWPNN